MTFEDAIRQAIKTYFEKSDDFDAFETSKDRKYSKKYFDGLKEEYIGKKTEDHEKEIGKKKEKY